MKSALTRRQAGHAPFATRQQEAVRLDFAGYCCEGGKLMRLPTILILLGFLATPHLSQAQNFVRLGAPFGDHMVLQHDAPIVLWGTGCPGGAPIKVYIAGQTAWTRSDWQGRWQLPLKPMKPGGPYQLLIEIGGAGPLVPSPAANSRGGAELNDVMIGEVVLASSLTNAGKESPSANFASPHP